MFKKVGRLLKCHSNFFGVTYIIISYIYMDTNTITPCLRMCEVITVKYQERAEMASVVLVSSDSNFTESSVILRNLIYRSTKAIIIYNITEYHGSVAGGRVPSSSTGLATKMDTVHLN